MYLIIIIFLLVSLEYVIIDITVQCIKLQTYEHFTITNAQFLEVFVSLRSYCNYIAALGMLNNLRIVRQGRVSFVAVATTISFEKKSTLEDGSTVPGSGDRARCSRSAH